MKYVALCGGLGNQMFQYAYYLKLKQMGLKVRTFIPDNRWEHAGGYELERVFGIEHKSSIWERLYHYGFPFTRLFTLIHRQYNSKNFIVSEEDIIPLDKYGYFYGTWQSERYFNDTALIRKIFQFKEDTLSQQSFEIANSLRGGTVAVHIRRGDYQSPSFSEGFGCCCPLEYYHKAISYLITHFPNATYVFFSDDMNWVKEKLKVENAIYVDHNHGLNSWQDMYLMSQCTHNIIANSTFSWWGAWLNDNPNKIVVAPQRWWNTIENDDVVPKSWIRL